MKGSRSSQAWKWFFVLITGIVTVVLFLIYFRYPAWDFRNNLWGPGRLLLQDQLPYDPEALKTLSATWQVPFYLSIWFPTIVGTGLPLAAISLPHAANLWLVLSLAATLCTVGLIHRFFKLADSRRALLTLVLIVSFFAPLYPHLMQGQVSLVVLGSLVIGWVLLEQDHPAWAGLFLSIGWAKPQLVLLAWPALAWLAVEKRELRIAFTGWLTGSLAQTIPLWLLDPTWPSGYLSALRANPVWFQPNVHSLLVYVTQSKALSWFLTILALALGSYWIAHLWRNRGRVLAFSWAFALTPTLSPYTWSYDQVLLLPLMVVTLCTASPGPRRAFAWIVFLACQVAYVALRLQASSDVWYAWYPPVLILLGAWVAYHPVNPVRHHV